jgi:hypothetical protein
MSESLISMIEGAAPTIAAALSPGVLSGPAKMFAELAISHLAEGLGLDHPSTPEEILKQLTGVSPVVRDAVLTRADANFQNTISPAIQAASPAPLETPSTLSAPPVDPRAGVTSDLPSMLCYLFLAAIGGSLASKGVDLGNISQSLFGSPDLHIGASILAGAIMLVVRNVIGTNKNTLAVAQADK